MLDILHLQHLAGFAELDLVALRPRAGQRGQLGNRKLALRQDVEHFAPDIAGGTHHRYPITHFMHSSWAPGGP